VVKVKSGVGIRTRGLCETALAEGFSNASASVVDSFVAVRVAEAIAHLLAGPTVQDCSSGVVDK